jgi:chloramphenicol-sensitive protein RarD
MSEPGHSASEIRAGVLAVTGAYVLWGVMPLYLKLISFADVLEVLGQRVLWTAPASVIAIVAISGARQGWRDFAAALRPGMLIALAGSAICIFSNWAVYVWSVVQHHVLEAALGYFIAPLAQVALGVFAFRERVRPLQMLAIAIASAGVVMQAVSLGAAPWVAIGICVTWVCYAWVRRKAAVPAATGLLIETLILAPFAALLLFWLSHQHPLSFGQNALSSFYLALIGVTTATPLILFSFGVRRVSFVTMGALQYLSPMMQFGLGLLWGEHMSPLRAASFGLIWAALVVFTLDSVRSERAARRAARQAP